MVLGDHDSQIGSTSFALHYSTTHTGEFMMTRHTTMYRRSHIDLDTHQNTKATAGMRLPTLGTTTWTSPPKVHRPVVASGTRRLVTTHVERKVPGSSCPPDRAGQYGRLPVAGTITNVGRGSRSAFQLYLVVIAQQRTQQPEVLQPKPRS